MDKLVVLAQGLLMNCLEPEARDLSNHTRILELGLKTITVLKYSEGAEASSIIIQTKDKVQLDQELQASGEVPLDFDKIIVDADIVLPHARAKLDQDELGQLPPPDLLQNLCAVIAVL
uniref:Uncharacterized protein n=1 Tax=Plectus sambesii TaxID=2011161 RepID=A0A914UM90_9BILA